MRKVLLLALVFSFVFTVTAFAQVIADFTSDANGFYDGNWGVFITSIEQMADPTGSDMGGVLAVHIDANQTGGDPKDPIAHSGMAFEEGTPALMSYEVWLPSDCPDGITIKVYTQDGTGNWTWKDKLFDTGKIPKEAWYTVYFSLEQAAATSNADYSNGVNGYGIEFSGWNLAGDDTTWTGTIYVDNVSLVGVEPQVIADFTDGLNDFYDGNWGVFITDIAQMADPTSSEKGGVLAVNIDANQTGGDPKDPIAHSGMDFDAATTFGFSYEVWLPSDAPDGILLKVYTQDGTGSWSWKDFLYYTQDLPKEKWYPIYFNLGAASADGSADYTDGVNGFGIEFSGWNLAGDDTTYTGTIYVDNVKLIGMETGKKWVVADFENEGAGTQGFTNTNWDADLTSVNWLADPTGMSNGVMETKWSFGGDVAKGAFQQGNISVGWTETDTGATSLSFDVYLPEDIPTAGSQLSIWVADADWDPWTEDKYSISDSTIIPGQWNTISYDIKKYANSEENYHPTDAMTVGVQLYYSAMPDWSGSIYFDNFTMYGIEEPEGETISPTITTEIDTATGFPGFYYVTIGWADSGPGTESYDVFMSKSPISDLGAEGVIRIADKIPHGEEYWVHRPWSTGGEEETFYYAVVANKADGTKTDLTEDCKAGPVTLTTCPTAKAKYVADFASSFSLDGLDNEFQDYAEYKLTPENAGGAESAGWTPESSDLSWATTFIIDSKYLYISADVTDDDLNAEGSEPKYSGTQPWMGDALEFFVGYYNANLLDDWHKHRDVDAAGTGDFRIAFTAWGTTGTATSNDTQFPGVEATVYQKFTGDGYIIEARIELDSLALDHHLAVIDGARLPMQINCNDLDPSNGDSSRTLQANWGGQSGHEVWLRPSGWGFLEVLDGPTAIDDDVVQPGKYELYANYPNPFNPTTTIKYQVPEVTDVAVEIYDILGNKVTTLFKGKKSPGTYELMWNGKNNAGVQVSSGLYFYKLKTKNFTKTHKMMLLK